MVNELSTVNIRINRQKDRINLLEHENMNKLKEIDRLIDDGDRSRDELGRLHRKYNFNSIEKSYELCDSFASWASAIIPLVGKIKGVLHDHFKCHLCGSIPVEMMINWPCEHIFCKNCLKN